MRQRERIVVSTSCGLGAHRIHTVAGGGSSIALSRTLAVRSVIRSASSMMTTRHGEFTGADTLKNVLVKTRVPGGEWELLAIGVPGDGLGGAPAADLQSAPLGDLDFVFVVAPHHPLAQAPEPLLTLNPGDAPAPEGSLVRKGQLLFQIDPRPFQVTLDTAAAQLQQAEVLASQARV